MKKQIKRVSNGVSSINVDVEAIFANWRSPYITRDKLYEATGGMIHPKTIRNLDSLNRGPSGKFHCSYRKVAYPVAEVVSWLKNRIAKHNSEKRETENV